MIKRITIGYRVMKLLYALPKGASMTTDNIWKRTNLKKKVVIAKLVWLRKRKLVHSTMIRGYKNGAPYKKAMNYLTSDGWKYMQRRAERERLEKLYPPPQEGENVVEAY